MKAFAVLAALLGLASAIPSNMAARQENPGYTIARPGGIDDIVITSKNTLNSTAREDDGRVGLARVPVPANLPIRLVNNFAGGRLNAYITGLDSDGQLVFISASGGVIYPRSGGSAVPVPVPSNVAIPLPPQGQTLTITLPIALSSGRIYFAEGNLPFFVVTIPGGREGLVQPTVANLQDPSAGLNWGFVEFTLTTEGVIWANISFVDFVGLVFGMSVRSRAGRVQEVLGLPAGSVARLCASLSAQQASEGRPWASHCITDGSGRPLRVLSPNIYAGINPGAFSTYWARYVDEVWQHYRTNTLRVNTQSGAGVVSCRVSGDLLQCDGDNRGYRKPSATDIWSCNGGPFAIQQGDNAIHYAVVPRLCAAFVRTTLLLAGGNTQPGLPESAYYTRNPTHHYSRLVHEAEIDGKGYAFPYDDVNPDGAGDAAGLVAESNPESVSFFIGGVRV